MRLLHRHGKADGTVPLTGRKIRPGLAQGNVVEAMELWRRPNGTDLQFARREGWAQMALDWFEAR